MRSALVVDPVETRLDGETCQHAVLGTISVARGDVHGATLVVKGICRMKAFFVPAFRDPQPHARPLVHHGDRQRVQPLLAALRTTQTVTQGSQFIIVTGCLKVQYYWISPKLSLPVSLSFHSCKVRK